MTEFGPAYADWYDALYGDKDYASEVNLIERIVKRYGHGPVHRILDLGCGTGNHAIPLARRGYEVVGIDRSPLMVDQARAKVQCADFTGAATFICADIRHANLDHEFDMALMMFAVLGYQLSDDDVLLALQTARRHLTHDGLLLFDVWYGPAVVQQGPSDREKRVAVEGGSIRRAASAAIDTLHHRCDIRYQLVWEGPGTGLKTTEELHRMRYFFPEEIALFLARAGFDLIRLGAFDNLDSDPNHSTWNAMVVARPGERM